MARGLNKNELIGYKILGLYLGKKWQLFCGNPDQKKAQAFAAEQGLINSLYYPIYKAWPERLKKQLPWPQTPLLRKPEGV